MERMTRIELARPAWEAGVLPLNYTRKAIQPNYYSTKAFHLQGVKREFFVTYQGKSGGLPKLRQEGTVSAGKVRILQPPVFPFGNGNRPIIFFPEFLKNSFRLGVFYGKFLIRIQHLPFLPVVNSVQRPFAIIN